ncbi:MAG: hypothetical protein GC171_11985 [Terrimonas sp.]|nr:hypothetical protein [Terrimonas sp.]
MQGIIFVTQQSLFMRLRSHYITFDIRQGLVLLCLMVALLQVHAQEEPGIKAIDVTTIKKGIRIVDSSEFAFVPKSFDIREYNTVNYRLLTPKNYWMAPINVSKKILLRFRLSNSGDSLSGVYFFPGFYFSDIQLYIIRQGAVQPLPRILPDHPDSIGFRYLSLHGNDSVDILAAILQEKTYTSILSPKLINENYLAPYILEQSSRRNLIDQVTFVFCGLLLMMIMFSLATFAMGANKEFLLYAGYALMLGLMLFSKSHFSYHISRVSYLLESYIDFILQGIGYCCYMAFMILFIETRKKHPFLHKLYLFSILVLVVAIVGYSFWHFSMDDYYTENIIENSTKFFLIAMAVIFMVYSARHWYDRLLRYLFWGNLFLLLFSILSQVLILTSPFRNLKGIFGSSLFYYEIGLFMELLFFLMGLAYKNRRQIINQTQEKERLKLDNERKELEKQMAVMAAHQEERDRISADMHDELGSGMTTIRLMSEIAKNKMKEETPVEIEKISQSANDVLNKMNAIIWSMNSGNDSLDNLVSYIRSYSLEYFEGTNINCKVLTPDDIPVIELSGDKRRNIFLCVKESLNNILKHASATSVKIVIHTDEELSIMIHDNGIGIDTENLREFGNGLKNIAKRMEKIGGSFQIEKDGGTITTLIYPL